MRKTKATAPIIVALLLLHSISVQSQQPKRSNQSKPPGKTQEQTLPADDDVVRIDLNLIQVDAVVTDKRGRQVTNLTAEDFSIIENGRTHAADYCLYIQTADDPSRSRRLTERPPSTAELGRTFVFLVDNPRIEFASSYATISRFPTASFSLLSRAIRGAVEAEKLLTGFVENEMGPRDLVAIGDTEVDIGVLASFTNDRATLREAIRHIRNSPTSGLAPVVKVTSINGDFVLVELVRQNLRVLETVSSIISQLETLPGRKAITLLSRGMLFNPQFPGADVVIERMQKLIEQANRARVSIYALSPAGVGNFKGDTLQNFDSLIHLARETGGRAIYNTNDTRVGFAEVVEKTRGYYLLAYKAEPGDQTRPHAIKVHLNRSDLLVEARTTAYSRGESRETSSPTDELRAKINSPLSETAIPVKVTPSYAAEDAKMGQIFLVVNVGLSEDDVPESTQLEGEFDLALRITGPDGKLEPPSIHKLAFTAGGEERSRLLSAGISTRFQVPAEAPGFYRISVAVQSKRTGLIGSTNTFFAVAPTSKKR